MLQRLTQNSDPTSPWRLWVNQFLFLQCLWPPVLERLYCMVSLVKGAGFLWARISPSPHSTTLSFNFLSESYRNDNSPSAGSLPGLREMWWGNWPRPQPTPQPSPGESDSDILPQPSDFHSRWNVLINFESGYFELSKKLQNLIPYCYWFQIPCLFQED